MKKLVECVAILVLYVIAEQKLNAQSLPPIFKNTPKALVKATTFSSFPVKTFLENIVVDEEGNLFITSMEEGVIYKITPGSKKTEFAKVNAKIAGIVYAGKNTFYLTGWNADGEATIFKLSGSGNIEPAIQLDDAYFLNGITPFTKNTFLICDSYKGAIWKFDAASNTSSVWLQDDLLSRVDTSHQFPAANGIKIHKGKVYVSNTDKQLLITIPLIDNNPGKPSVFMNQVNLDDFAFDENDNIYATTHVYNSVLKITPAKEVFIIAEEKEGVTGSTALAFGRTSADKNIIYVTTNGGISYPPVNGLENAKVVKLTFE
jgi:sugar lactone lactonase YvrE